MNLWDTVWKCELMFEMLFFGFLLCRHFVKRSYFWLRAAGGAGVCLFGSVILVTNTKSVWESIPGVIIMFLLSMLTFLLCYECSTAESLFVSVAAYIVQIILYSVFIILQELSGIKGGLRFVLLYIVILAAAAGMVRCFMEKKMTELEKGDVSPAFLVLLFSMAFLIDTVFKFYMVEHSLGRESGGIFIAWKTFSMFSCILLLAVQFGTLRSSILSADKKQLEELLYQKQEQFRISRENIELINIKCHDLKHMLRNITGEAYEKEAERIQKELSIYDSMFQTGNQTLDTILTGKKLHCEYNKINMTCIAEGEKLYFLSETELCSLFGNIVDNAVTAVSHLEEEKRTISLLVRSQGNFLSIHEENYYEGELVRSGDGFETTRKDKAHHGFGLKSVRMIVEAHHGNMTVEAEDGVFNINILIPLPARL